MSDGKIIVNGKPLADEEVGLIRHALQYIAEIDPDAQKMATGLVALIDGPPLSKVELLRMKIKEAEEAGQSPEDIAKAKQFVDQYAELCGEPAGK